MAVPSSWHEEDGFSYRLFPAKTEKPDCLIFYLHGLNNVPELPDSYIQEIHAQIPGADVIALQAPIKIRKSNSFPDPKGYSWFPLAMSVKSEVKHWLSHIFKRMAIAGKVESFAKGQLEKRGLTENKLAYYGHSMGGIVALQAGLSGDKPVAAIVSLGGSVVPLTKVKNNSKVFLQMGEKDEIFNQPPVPVPEKGFLQRIFAQASENMSLRHERSIGRLKDKVPLTEKMYPGQGHTHNDAMWKDGVEFIARAFKP